MKVYKYIAKTLEGRTIRGKCEANNFHELLEVIKKKGYYLLSFKHYDSRKVIWNKNKISYEIISLFCNQFKSTLHAGLTILETFHILSFQCSSKLLRDNLTCISGEIKNGKSLYISLESCPHSFPLFFCQMIKVGEESGKLEAALDQLSNFYYKEHILKKKIAGAMFYPTIVFIVTLISLIILLSTVIPSISSVLVSLGVELPVMTRILINISSTIKENFTLVITIILLIVLLTWFLFQYIKESSITNRIVLKIPVIGTVYGSLNEMKISRSLSMLLSGGINILGALEILAETSNRLYLETKLKNIISQIRGGYSLSEAMASTSFFSPFLLSIVRIGEETGNLDAMLEKASIILEENLQSDISKLTELIQPIMLLISAGIIGGVITSVILPIFDVASAI